MNASAVIAYRAPILAMIIGLVGYTLVRRAGRPTRAVQPPAAE